MPGGIELNGISALIAALALAGGTVLQVATFLRQAARDRKLQQMHELVNGASNKLNKLTAAKSFAAGQKSGRAHPSKRKRA